MEFKRPTVARKQEKLFSSLFQCFGLGIVNYTTNCTRKREKRKGTKETKRKKRKKKKRKKT